MLENPKSTAGQGDCKIGFASNKVRLYEIHSHGISGENGREIKQVQNKNFIAPVQAGELGNHLQGLEENKQPETKGHRHFGNRCRQSSSANCPTQSRTNGNEQPRILLETQGPNRKGSDTHIHSQTAEIILGHIPSHDDGKKQGRSHHNPKENFVFIHLASNSTSERLY
jgi:hypothetical protein